MIRLLVHLPNWIGDTIMALPSLESVAGVGEWQTTLLGRPEPLALTAEIPGFHRRIELPPRPGGLKSLGWYRSTAWDLRRERFDVALTLSPSLSSALLLKASGAGVRVGWTGEGRALLLNRLFGRKRRGRIHLVDEFWDLVRALGAPGHPDLPRLRLSGEEEAGAKNRLERFGDRPIIALAPGARYGPTKKWFLERYQELADRLLREGFGLLWMGGPDEKGLLGPWMDSHARDERVMDLIGALALRESAAVLGRCRAAVANDSGAMHLAQSVGCPTVALFGSSDPNWTGPRGRSRIVRNPVSCAPCFLPKCPHALECWDGISVEDVWTELQSLLHESEARTKRRAVFFDRDGVLIHLVPYLSSPHQLRLYDDVGSALRTLKEAGFTFVVVTNQSALARGLLTRPELQSLHRLLKEKLREEGVALEGIYVCHHHPRFTGTCGCRKPEPGLLKQAAAELDLDLPSSFLIGDRLDDVIAAKRAGVQGLLVRTGYGVEESKRPEAALVHTADNLTAAARWILRRASASTAPSGNQ